MVLLPCSKCCGPCWRCYTDGTDYECVGPDDTSRDGWEPVGDCHPTEQECAAGCVPPEPQCWQKYFRWSTDYWPCWIPEVTIGDYTPVENSLVMEIDRSAGSGIPNPTQIQFRENPAFPDFLFCGNIYGNYESGIQFDCNYGVTTVTGYASNAECFGDGRHIENVINKFIWFECNVLASGGSGVDGCVSSQGPLWALKPGKNFVPLLANERTDLVGYLTVCLNWSPVLDPSIPGYNPSAPVPEQSFECFKETPLDIQWHLACSGDNDDDCFNSYEECKNATKKTPGGRTMPTTKTIGPGTHLANLFKWFGIHAKEKGCGCKSMQGRMDKGGPQWCRDHKDEILDHLAKEAKKRGLPFVRLAAGKLVDLAIRRAEKDSA